MLQKSKLRLLLGALLLASCLTTLADAPASGQVAPAWQLQDLDAKPVKLSDFKGKVVVLNFWATWCPPCRAEIPALISLQQQYSPRGLVVIGVALDQGGAAVVKPFVKKMEIDYFNVIGDQKMTQAYGGITVVPTTFIIDRQGKIVTEQKGAADRASLEAEIKLLL
ncbi:MAG: TlpA family protein disulfide reductase [Verrucomicrobiota bacterium]|nr:TlpA family protein disulfide reductase [Verrucomicrobiota bacterium]